LLVRDIASARLLLAHPSPENGERVGQPSVFNDLELDSNQLQGDRRNSEKRAGCDPYHIPNFADIEA
jgi:hypothetical protein